MIRRWIGKILWLVIRAAGRCLAVFLLQKIIERGNAIMATQKTTVWGSLAQLIITIGAGYLGNKVVNDKTAWAPYREQLIQGAAATAITALAEAVQPQTTDQSTDTTTAQQ